MAHFAHTSLALAFAFYLAGCVNAPVTGDAAVTRDEATAFAKEFEAHIRASDWEAVRRSFLSTARVLYQTPGDPVSKTFTPGQLVETLRLSTHALGFARGREIYSVELRANGALVRSVLVEKALAPGGRIEVTSHELMRVARDGDALRIFALGIWVSEEDVEDLAGEGFP